ncbi:MAG: cytochrome c [Kordia sp.]
MKAAISIFVFLISAGIAVLYLVNVKELEKTNASQQTFGVCGGGVYSDSYFHEEITEEIKKGKALFNANCAACHKLNAQSTGPALRGIHERYTTVDIIKFMRNDFSSAIQYTNEKGYKCTPFPDLSDEDIESILLYTY